jgi:radical SAM superfamily enzyme YgiQ (UPF0313 family)
MRAAATFILGGPGETIGDIGETVSFAQSLPLDFAHFNPLALYPGTTLFTEVFGHSRREDWLDLCLDRELAPNGDILWSDSDFSIEMILSSIAEAYRGFYSEDRLASVLPRLPLGERDMVRSAYSLLANHRADSWPITVPAREVDSRGVNPQC